MLTNKKYKWKKLALNTISKFPIQPLAKMYFSKGANKKGTV